MIWAQARRRVIGIDGALPWRLPEDLAMFKRITTGHPVIMGRATWDSLPPPLQPLPDRANVVITRDPGWMAPGARVVNSPEQARQAYPDAWVIGGASIYAALLPYAGRVICTLIDLSVHGDTFAPQLGNEWRCVDRRPPEGWLSSRNGLRYAVCDIRRACDE